MKRANVARLKVAIGLLPLVATLWLLRQPPESGEPPDVGARAERTWRPGQPSLPGVDVRPSAAVTTHLGAKPGGPQGASSSPLARFLAAIGAPEGSVADDIARLRAEVLAWANDDPARAAAELVDALRAAEDELAASSIVSVLVQAFDVASRPEVASALLDIARNDPAACRRSAAAKGLGELPHPDEARVGEIASIARADTAEDVRLSAAFALGAVSDRSPGELSARAARELAASLDSEPSGAVRTGLIYSVRDTRQGAVVDGLLGALANDSEIAARQAAADVLGDVAPPHRVRTIEALASRFEAETERDMKLTLLTSLIRAGREGATATLVALAPRAGALAEDVNDYLEGLRSGETDMDRLYAMKQARESARGAAWPAGDTHDHD